MTVVITYLAKNNAKARYRARRAAKREQGRCRMHDGLGEQHGTSASRWSNGSNRYQFQ